MNQEIAIRDLVHLIADILCVKVEIAQDNERLRPERSEVERLMCDNKKLLANTGWRPLYDLRSGLEETVSWFRSNAELARSSTYTI
jgi:nucleoside-diphosphate-sugar epimerase